jgi:hypothetical protein
MDLTKIVVLAVVGLIILVTLLGEFRPRARAARRNRRSGEAPVRGIDPERVAADSAH